LPLGVSSPIPFHHREVVAVCVRLGGLGFTGT